MGLFSRNNAPAARDFSPEDNPTSPIGVFFTVLRINFGNIVKVNLLYFLFMIPTLAWMFFNILALNNVLETSAILEQELTFVDLVPTFTTFLAGCIVTELPLGPAKCALAYVMRFLSQDEHSFVIDDFFAAYKANWKQGILLNLITSVLNLLVFVAAVSYWNEAQTTQFFLILMYVILVLYALFLMMQQYFFPMMATYSMGIYQMIRTSMILCIAKLPLSLLSLILGSLVGAGLTWYALMDNMTIGVTVGILFYALLGYALGQLVRSSFVHRIFNEMLITPEEEAKQAAAKAKAMLDAEKGGEVLPEDRA